MSVLTRSFGGLREQLRSQPASVVTLALALFCVAGALLVFETIGALAQRWSAPAKMTVYLTDGASSTQVEGLRSVLDSLPEVRHTRYIGPAEARAMSLSGAASEGNSSVSQIPVDVFPTTIEVELVPSSTTSERIATVAERIRRLSSVSEVETYRGVTEQLQGLLLGGRAVAALVSLVVFLCATAVVGNTVRLSLHARMREVEVLRLVGASPSYVRAPFLVEGAMLGALGSLIAVAILGGIYMVIRTRFNTVVTNMMGIEMVFLSWTAVTSMILGGAIVGATGSALAVRRALRV